MTENEAIERIKELKSSEKIQELDYAEIFIKVCDMEIQALEKQIPKSPTYEGDGYTNGVLVYDTWICPCCGHHYEVDYDDYDYCPKCGQKIDWSENE